MKLFLKAIALAAKDSKFQGNPRDELNRLIDVAEATGLTVWHDDFCFKSTFWDWGNRESGTVNWGGYGSSYKPANENYFKFQYRGDTVDANAGKLISRKGAKPLDAVKALVLPEADADGAMQALLAKAGANPVYVADKGLKTDAIVDLLAKKKCNFLLTADDLPKGLTDSLDKAAESKKYFFTLPVGRLRPLLEKAPKAPVKRGPKAPPAFADKDDAKAFSKLKALLASQKFEEIDQAITLLPGLPGACDKLLEGISLTPPSDLKEKAPDDPGSWPDWEKKHPNNPDALANYLAARKAYESFRQCTGAITAWTNDAKAWTADYSRPDKWGDNRATLPSDLTVLGETFRLAEIPKNDLFNTSEAKRYALFSVINAAPEDCAAAKAIREGLVALHWKDDRLPPISNFKGLRHLYLDGCNGNESIGGIISLVFTSSGYRDGLAADWILPIKSLKRLDLSASLGGDPDDFLKKASFPNLEELVWPRVSEDSLEIPREIRDVRVETVAISHAQLENLLRFPRFRAGRLYIKTGNRNADQNEVVKSTSAAPKVVPVKDRGEALSTKEMASLKKLLRDDDPGTVIQGLKILRTTSPATIDALLEKSSVTWGSRDEGILGYRSNSKLSGPFFDSLKRNDLGEAVRINLLSLATPGCKAADNIRTAVSNLSLPPVAVPIDVGGFQAIRRLTVSVAPKGDVSGMFPGLSSLGSLQHFGLNLLPTGQEVIRTSGVSRTTVMKNPPPMNLVPPTGVTSMAINLECGSVEGSLSFIQVSPNLKSLSMNFLTRLESLSELGGLDPLKLESLETTNYFPTEDLTSPDLTGLSPFVNLLRLKGYFSGLTSLRGISALNKLRELDFKTEALVDLSEASAVTSLKSISLGSDSDSALQIAPLAFLPELTSLECGGHRVLDTGELLRFRESTEITIKNFDHRNV